MTGLTHKRLTKLALKNNSFGKFDKDIVYGSVAEDNFSFIPSIGGLKHYYNPQQKNKVFNAYTRAVRLFNASVYFHEKGEDKKSHQLFGRCLHIVQDLNNPFHLSKKRFLTLEHSEFEKKMEEHFIANESLYKKNLPQNQNILRYDGIEGILNKIVKNSVKMLKTDFENNEDQILRNTLDFTLAANELFKSKTNEKLKNKTKSPVLHENGISMFLLQQ